MLDERDCRGAWSAVVAELAGRLRIELEELQPGLRHAVWLELWNHGPQGMRVTNQPGVEAELHTVEGTPVSAISMPASGPRLAAQPALVPGGAYLGMRIDRQIIGMPMREQRAALVALGDRSWVIGPGRYRLRAVVTFPGAEDERDDGWSGSLDLPPVEFALRL